MTRSVPGQPQRHRWSELLRSQKPRASLQSRASHLKVFRIHSSSTMPPLAPFKIGQKQIHLSATQENPKIHQIHNADKLSRPNFTLTLLRTPHLPPTFATFIAPLNLNKLDIRDYLFHVYGVTCLKVRSYVQQQRVRQGKPGELRPAPRRWYRPRAVKRMTVEMDKPFVWPEAPKDFEP